MPTFESVRFGTLQYDQADVLELPEGLIGLPQLRRWLILEMERDVPMRWMQSLDRPDFGLPVMPPVFFADEYEVTSTTLASRQLASDGAPELVTLIIANIHPGGGRITGNLKAPLVLDTVTRRGAQLALEDDELSTRQEIDYLKFALALAGDSSQNDPAEAEAAAQAEEQPLPGDADEDAMAELEAQTVSSGS